MSEQTAVIGLGFVGVPLVQLLLSKDHSVIGVDTDPSKIHALLRGKSYLSDLSDQDIQAMKNTERFFPTTDFSCLSKARTVIICVPTPLRNREPDLSYVEAAVTSAMPHLKKGTLVILESSTYPGTTEGLLKPLLEKNGFSIGTDLYLAYSPERIDPGSKLLSLASIPKVISGVTPACLSRIHKIYDGIFQQTVPVSSPSVAEFTKILENSQRLINISFMNEVNLIANKLNIDLWESIEAAKTKPIGFTPYYPGPGIGGHCIPIDPFYLSWVARQHGLHLSMIEQAGAINDIAPYQTSRAITTYLSEQGIDPAAAKVGVIGVTYKKDVNDVRESPALKVADILKSRCRSVKVHDPVYEGPLDFDRFDLTERALKAFDLTVILVDHKAVDWAQAVAHSNRVFDTRNITRQFSDPKIKRV
ncbi:UDP-N-acetyl-D-glucosamine dehydrogenase [Alteribacter lacisalsi]|uniref:UDP-N-acetyl-D-glucosamine dehydrogenase n=1 Tax=Alteribacter lacisalsi TaxID=2045244 RepID=A0A2W0H9G5_9BACI|nr:nucleotide sugar dehydrogenase [Alteribacter lacisalsi]PYZ97571.1 UDP-N-acetyl-D-glucosamine dehydrogenase [Alteribacter lacisalsi]